MSNFWDITSKGGARGKNEKGSKATNSSCSCSQSSTDTHCDCLAGLTYWLCWILSPLMSGNTSVKCEGHNVPQRSHCGIWDLSWFFSGLLILCCLFLVRLKVKLQILSRFSLIRWLWNCWITLFLETIYRSYSFHSIYKKKKLCSTLHFFPWTFQAFFFPQTFQASQ